MDQNLNSMDIHLVRHSQAPDVAKLEKKNQDKSTNSLVMKQLTTILGRVRYLMRSLHGTAHKFFVAWFPGQRSGSIRACMKRYLLRTCPAVLDFDGAASPDLYRTGVEYLHQGIAILPGHRFTIRRGEGEAIYTK